MNALTRYIATLVLSVSSLAMSACKDAAAEAAQLQAREIELIQVRALAEARARAQVEAESGRARAEAEAQAARIRAEAERAEAEAKRVSAEAYAKSEAGQRRQAVADVTAIWRISLGIDNTWVLNMHNGSDVTADFQLRCTDINRGTKTFSVAIVAGATQELGFMEGWDGNFVRGESCAAIYEGQVVWTVTKR